MFCAMGFLTNDIRLPLPLPLPGRVKNLPVHDKSLAVPSHSSSDQDMGKKKKEANDASSKAEHLEDESYPLLPNSHSSDHATETEHTEPSCGSSSMEVTEDMVRSLCDDSEMISPRASTSELEARQMATITTQWRGFLSLLRQRSSVKHMWTLPSLGGLKLPKTGSKASREKRPASFDLYVDPDFCSLKPSWKIFTLEELRAATKNFSADNLIGKGGYGEVYRGCLKDGRLVAVKRLVRGTVEERTTDFLSELGIIVHINHRNAAQLIGLGIEGGMYLVLKLSPNGSLATFLHDSKEKLDWSIRYKVALGSAEGLHYLHEVCPRRIIHRDIKAANILLTHDFEPEICDFGLAKWLPDSWTHHTMSDFEGTFGYVAPECLMHGIVDEKTDIYSYGVLLLEIITGKTALDASQRSLVMWATPLLEKNDIRQLVDPSLGGVYDSQQMDRMVLAASLCIQQSSMLRPRMSQILELLKGEANMDSMKLRRKSLLHRTLSDIDFDIERSNSSKYLAEVNRQRHIAMEI